MQTCMRVSLHIPLYMRTIVLFSRGELVICLFLSLCFSLSFTGILKYTHTRKHTFYLLQIDDKK